MNWHTQTAARYLLGVLCQEIAAPGSTDIDPRDLVLVRDLAAKAIKANQDEAQGKHQVVQG